jgi:hypothetical protein
MMLLDSVAFGLSTLSFYLDRRATDNYLSTARTRKSVARLTRQLGYKMRAAVASSVDLSITIASPGFNVPMPKGFQFSGPDGLIYECAQPVTWLATDSIRTKSVACYEGVTVVENFVSDGSANQVFQLRQVPDQSFCVSGSVTVVVNGTPFVESEFLSFDATNQFELGYNDDPPTVRFGDGIAGNIPMAGATIVVTYVASRGLSGLVNSHTITAEKNPLVVAFQPVAMTVDNPLGSVGGDNPETLSHAKAFAPLVYKSRFVAVTRPDYEALSGSFADPLFGRVAVAQAVSSRSADADAHLNTNIAIIEGAADAPLLTTAGPFTLNGTASVASGTGVVTGAGTKFLSDLVVGSIVKFGVDPGAYRVTALTDDLQCTVTPIPLVAIPVGTIVRYGKDMARARSSLRDVSEQLEDLVAEISETASEVADVDASLVTATAEVRTQRSQANSAKLDVDSALVSTNAAQVTVTAFATSPTQVGTGGNFSVVYAPKVAPTLAPLMVLHSADVALAVAVTGSLITVSVNTGVTTARQVAEAVNAHAQASTMVLAAYTGDGAGPVVPALAATIPVYVPASTRTDLLATLDTAADKVGAASTTASGVVSGLEAIVTATLDPTRQQVADIGTTVAMGRMEELNTYANTIRNRIGPAVVLDAFDSLSFLDDVATSLANMDASVLSNKATIQEALDQIYDHVDALLSADCKANLVTVPILAKDKAGFFTAPSNGLIHALQGYLNARKEVTQTVQVTSGANALVPAVIRVRVGVNPSFSESITKTSVESAIDSVLRGRLFGDDLYLSDLQAVVAPLAGVVFANIQIMGPQNRLDTGVGSVNPNGNLIINTDEIITKGQVTITTETVTVR